MNVLEAKKGIDVILLYRLLKNASKEAAWKMAFQTEHENELSRDTDAVDTKDGKIQTLKPVEYDFSATSIVAKGDERVDELKQALINGEIIEIWEIDKAEVGTKSPNTGKYKATYYQGYVASFKATANAEDALELEMEFAINGVGKEGYATLSTEQANAVQYVFEDTTQKTSS